MTIIKKCAIPLLSLLLLFGDVFPTQAALTTEFLAANNLNFTCTVLKHASEDADAPHKDIVLLHGFPMFRVWWLPLLEHWDNVLAPNNGDTVSVSLHAVACDLRGYSPGASPDDMEEYDYSIFAEDTFALARAAGFEEGFHLLGHDLGAVLAWYIAGNDPDNRVLSLTTLSVPHIGLFSDALCGDNTYEDQVIASNYFNQFSLPDGANRNNASLTNLFNGFGLGPLEPAQFQKMLWWYQGFPKYMSKPRVVSDEEVEAYEIANGPEMALFLKANREAIPMEERPCIPVEEFTVGAIEVPTLFVCGLGDPNLLCNSSYVTDFPPALLPNFEHANYRCGHDFFLDGDCDNMDESQATMEKITEFVFQMDGDIKGDTGAPEMTAAPDAGDILSSTSGTMTVAVKIPVIAAAIMALCALAW